jgi:hypothetical protein
MNCVCIHNVQFRSFAVEAIDHAAIDHAAIDHAAIYFFGFLFL